MSTAYRLTFRLFAALLATAIAASVGAQEDELCKRQSALAAQPLRMVANLDALDCLGGDRDHAPITKSVFGLLGKPPAAAAAPGNVVDTALGHVAEYVHGAARALDDPEKKYKPVLAAMALEIESVRNRFRAQQPLGEQHVKGWEWDRKQFRGLPWLDLAPLRITCAEATDRACVLAGETGKAVFRAAALVRQTLEFSLNDVYEEALAATRVRRAKWDAYFDDTRVQFPWELGASSYFHKWLGRDKGGFADVPNDQLILLHPGIGMEYVSGAPEGNRFEAALVLEIIGYNRWWWTKEGKVDTAVGVSYIQTYSDRAGLSSMRPGVMVHYNSKYSFAFTRKNGETGFMLSVDLAKLVTRVEEDAREKFRLGKNQVQ